MEEIEIGRFIIANGLHHGAVRAIRDGVSDAGFLAFELEPEFAVGTGKITRPRVVLQPAQRGRRAVWAVKILLRPKLRDHPRPLRTARVRSPLNNSPLRPPPRRNRD